MSCIKETHCMCSPGVLGLLLQPLRNEQARPRDTVPRSVLADFRRAEVPGQCRNRGETCTAALSGMPCTAAIRGRPALAFWGHYSLRHWCYPGESGDDVQSQGHETCSCISSPDMYCLLLVRLSMFHTCGQGVLCSKSCCSLL